MCVSICVCVCGGLLVCVCLCLCVCVSLPTSFHHAHFVALAQAAGLAALPAVAVYGALVGGGAHVVVVTWHRREREREP